MVKVIPAKSARLITIFSGKRFIVITKREAIALLRQLKAEIENP